MDERARIRGDGPAPRSSLQLPTQTLILAFEIFGAFQMIRHIDVMPDQYKKYK